MGSLYFYKSFSSSEHQYTSNLYNIMNIYNINNFSYPPIHLSRSLANSRLFFDPNQLTLRTTSSFPTITFYNTDPLPQFPLLNSPTISSLYSLQLFPYERNKNPLIPFTLFTRLHPFTSPLSQTNSLAHTLSPRHYTSSDLASIHRPIHSMHVYYMHVYV